MSKRSKHLKNPIHGWINLNKPVGIGSTQALGRVKWALKPQKAGHGGTLDPLADGVLPIALGEATKTVAYAMDADKDYVFTVTWGESRTTDDLEGEVLQTSDVRPSREAILAALPQFIGDISQIPPIYSALKIGGERAYDLARAGQIPEMTPRQITVYDLQLRDMDTNSATFFVNCGKGTYVRSLGRDLAVALGTVGHISRLTRTRVGAFCLEDAILLDSFDDNAVDTNPLAALLPIHAALDDILVLAVNGGEAAMLRRGMAVNFMSTQNFHRLPQGYDEGAFLAVDDHGDAVAFVYFDAGLVKPERVFNF